MFTPLLLSITAAVCSTPLGGDEQKARTEMERAEADMAKGRYAKAIERLQKVVKRFPGSSAARTAWERVQPNALLGWRDLLRHGPATNRVDIVVMGDGYLLEKQNSFDSTAADLPEVFSRDELFGEYFGYFNFVQANVISVESGIDEYGRERKTALGARLIESTNDDLVSVEHAAVRRVLGQMDAHDDLALVLVQSGHLGTSGPGVATVAARDLDRMLHLFGHAFGGLEDEAVDMDDFFSAGDAARGATSQANISHVHTPEGVPWAHWIEAGAPGIGVYEGAMGTVRGVWKPRASGCRMEGSSEFCAVCREALVLRIYALVDPIESASVLSSPELEPGAALTGGEPHEFAVEVLRPASHALEVRWWVLPAEEAPGPRAGEGGRSRGELGPLAPISVQPDAKTKERRGVHRFKLDPRRLEPGSYRVYCRVRDTTHLRGERFPWVLVDERDLLRSERVWRVEVGE